MTAQDSKKNEKIQHTCYSSNETQLVLMSMCIFACPGMYNALNSIGLGGDPSIGSLVNCCVYGACMISSFFAPTAVNLLGAKWALLLGTLGFPLYSLAMFYRSRGWAVAAGVFLGTVAGLLWTAQGQLMMSYPHRSQTGKFMAVFWGIFNSGAVLGSLMSFFINVSRHDEDSQKGGSALSAGTYWTFFCIMCAGCCMSTGLLPLRYVTRKSADGNVEHVVDTETTRESDSHGPTTLTKELILQELRRTVNSAQNPIMLLLAPFFFYSNFFCQYFFGINGVLFNGRTGSLTSACYWTAQILGSYIMQAYLDRESIPRNRRMRLSFVGILSYVVATWTFCGYIQYSYKISSEKQGLDFAGESESPLPAMVCLFACGFVDSFVQIWTYWTMSQLSAEPEDLSCYTAFYKFWQNAGALCSFLLFLIVDSYEVLFWTNIVLLVMLIVPTSLAIRRACLFTSTGPKKLDVEDTEEEATLLTV